MKKVLFGLSLLASAAGASAFPVCVSLADYCDKMQFDGKKSATWVNTTSCDGTTSGEQTKAKYKKKLATTTCIGAEGCDPAAVFGWTSLDWSIDVKASTATVSGVFDGVEYIIGQDMAASITEGTCAVTESNRGRALLAR